MDQETRYQYEKKIKNLQDEVNRLEPYKTLALEIYENICEHIADGTSLGKRFLLKKFRWVMK
jgi:hypothetical protein